MKKKFTIILAAILYFILFTGLVLLLSACKPGKLGLTLEDESESTQPAASTENLNISSQIFNEQSFYELKSRQANKNLLDDINIRKAIFFAIDRPRIVRELLGQYGSVLNSIFCQNCKYYYPAWNRYSYNPEKASEFLKKAGYDRDNPLYLTIGANADSMSRMVIEEIIKENLDAIGIKVWISNKESREWFVDYVKNGNYEIGIWAVSTQDILSIENNFSSGKIPPLETDTNKNCYNYYWYSSSNFDAILDKLIVETVPENKSSLNEQMQDILAEDAFFLPLYSRIYSVAYNKIVTGVDVDESSGSFFANIEGMDVSPDEKQESSSKKTDDKGAETDAVKSLVVGYQQEPYNLNPLIPDNVYRDYIDSLIIRGLWVKKDSSEHEPFLAESVSSGNGDATGKDDIRLSLKAHVKLKENIFWQDGTPFNATDVAETIKAIKQDESINYKDLDYSIIKSIETVSDHELYIVFNEYSERWKELFDIVFPAALLEENKISDLFAENIYGLGPYKLKEWVKGEYLLLEKNTFYSGNSSDIDAVKFVFNSDINYLIGMLEEGNIDILSIPSDPELMKEIEENEDLKLLVKPGNLWEHLALCLKPKQENKIQENTDNTADTGNP
ncbi:MAG: hypothetical protein FJW66_04075 [Actinobacteria bacterium]|nr:hypothetical protein [Actinomycetota bacterium]